MKTFEDLVFKNREIEETTCNQAKIEFDNGWGISVLQADETGPNEYCQAEQDSYEIAITNNGYIDYSYTDEDRADGEFWGVWTFQPKEKVEELMNTIQNFPKAE